MTRTPKHRSEVPGSLLKDHGLGSTTPEVFRFTPDLGPLEGRLVRLAQTCQTAADYLTAIRTALADAEAELAQSSNNPRLTTWTLALSLLADIAEAGGSVFVRDSAILVSWPDWRSPSGDAALRRALGRLQSETRRPPLDEKLRSAFANSLAPTDVEHLLLEGEVVLREGGDLHTSGSTYNQVFAAAASYWTMPIRDREGRNRRFVVTIDHPKLGRPVAAAILEVGDSAPQGTARDEMLGLTCASFLNWLQTTRQPEVLGSLQVRLQGLLRALQSPAQGLVQSVLAGERTISEEELLNLEQRAVGRSREPEHLRERKALSYAARLFRGLAAVEALRLRSNAPTRDLNGLVRLLRDLALPRLHLELTICGGLPPFSAGLAGKLAIAFAADPRIRGICGGDVGEILGGLFDKELLAAQLPQEGAVLLTTKGLYASHSAQYKDAAVPGINGSPVHLRKIGLTSGVTASLMSRRTYQLSQRFLAAVPTKRAISDEFGSGGSKRQRRIEAAVRELKLPSGLIHPRIQRPVYALSMVGNAREVAILNARPQWIVPSGDPTAYGQLAVDLWRQEYAPTASRRLRRIDESLLGLADWF